MSANFFKINRGFNLDPQNQYGSGDPSPATDGDVYYNQTLAKFRKHENGSWSDLSSSGSGITQLTGDVTAGPGSGSQVATISNSAVTNAKMANMAAHTYKGNNTSGSSAPIDVTSTQLTADLNLFTPSLQGLVPASGGGTLNFLRADGTFALPTASVSADIVTFPVSGTWTCPADVTEIFVTGVGAGGGGGRPNIASFSAGGGSGGCWTTERIAVTPGLIYTINIGAGGVGGGGFSGHIGQQGGFTSITQAGNMIIQWAGGFGGFGSIYAYSYSFTDSNGDTVAFKVPVFTGGPVQTSNSPPGQGNYYGQFTGMVHGQGAPSAGSGSGMGGSGGGQDLATGFGTYNGIAGTVNGASKGIPGEFAAIFSGVGGGGGGGASFGNGGKPQKTDDGGSGISPGIGGGGGGGSNQPSNVSIDGQVGGPGYLEMFYFRNLLTAIAPSLLMHFDSNILDSSIYNHTMSAAGTPVYNTGEFSQAAQMTADWAINTPSDSSFDFGTGDFTIEFFAQGNNLAGTSYHLRNRIITRYDTAVAFDWQVIFNGPSTGLTFQTSGSVQLTLPLTTGIEQDGLFHHYAISKKNNVYMMFFDGVAQTIVESGSTTYTNSQAIPFTAGVKLTVGGYTTSGTAVPDLHGLVDELRITKGVAVYTANFTPPSSPFNN